MPEALQSFKDTGISNRETEAEGERRMLKEKENRERVGHEMTFVHSGYEGTGNETGDVSDDTSNSEEGLSTWLEDRLADLFYSESKNEEAVGELPDKESTGTEEEGTGTESENESTGTESENENEMNAGETGYETGNEWGL